MNTKRMTPNEWADFWRYFMGENIFPVDTKQRRYFPECEVGEDKTISEQQYEKSNKQEFKIIHKVIEINQLLQYSILSLLENTRCMILINFYEYTHKNVNLKDKNELKCLMIITTTLRIMIKPVL